MRRGHSEDWTLKQKKIQRLRYLRTHRGHSEDWTLKQKKIHRLRYLRTHMELGQENQGSGKVRKGFPLACGMQFSKCMLKMCFEKLKD